jgi:hypothetical protein
VSKETRFPKYTRSVWQRDYEAYDRRPASWRESVATAIEALLGELRRCADEESLHTAYWEPGDWPAQVLLRNLPSSPGPETLLELEHAAFWLRCQELTEAK